MPPEYDHDGIVQFYDKFKGALISDAPSGRVDVLDMADQWASADLFPDAAGEGFASLRPRANKTCPTTKSSTGAAANRSGFDTCGDCWTWSSVCG